MLYKFKFCKYIDFSDQTIKKYRLKTIIVVKIHTLELYIKLILHMQNLKFNTFIKKIHQIVLKKKGTDNGPFFLYFYNK